MKKSVLLGVTLAALALPNIASASCGQTKGSFNVSCESGVQIYRHNALKAPSISPSLSARLDAQRDNNRVQREAIASRERIANQNAQLERRRIASDRFFQRSLVETPSNLARLGGNGFNNNGFNNFGFDGRRITTRFGFNGNRGRFGTVD